MEEIIFINVVIGVIFALCYSYQILYVAMALLKKDAPHKPEKSHHFAVLIAARNEENVIGHLIESIKQQTYTKGNISIFVVADNCTDQTAKKARDLGATVYERQDTENVGKGHAIDFLLAKISTKHQSYDGYFVFDADNVLDENYISEMNKTFSDGYDLITSYRNSKNYGDNWISAGYGCWFLWESEFLNRGRMLLKTSCAISGTGFFFSRRIIEKYEGWKFFLLTEDIQFTVDNIVSGEKVGYCRHAILYDEQPITFKQSFRQRMRWAKGFFQVFSQYGADLFKGSLRGSAACFDLLMVIMPTIILTVGVVLVNFLAIVMGDFTSAQTDLLIAILMGMFLNIYLTLIIIGTVTTITQWNSIHTTTIKKIGYIFTFPLFLISYVPITLAALFKKVEWHPIEHSCAKTLAEIKEG